MKNIVGMVLLMGASMLTLPSCSKLSAGDDVFDLKAGSCFDDSSEFAAESDEVSSVPMRECTEPHDNEAFYAYNLPDSTTIPSEAMIDADYPARCETAFAEYLGIDYQDSYYEYGVYSPTSESWNGGDREILCLAYDPSGEKLTESLRGIGR